MTKGSRSGLGDPRGDESGATLVLVAMVLVVLMGMAAFAVDYGWIFWNGIKIQHGADAAALSGVVYQPGDQVTSYAEARAAASENGFDDLAPETTVTPVDFTDDPTAVENAHQLAVTVQHEIPTFFMSVFGIDSVTITKRAVAEYALPLAMGSDDPFFGNDPALGRNPRFWGSIQGYYTQVGTGDRFASQCYDNPAGAGCNLNPERRPTASAGMNNGRADFTGGYLYGIEVPVGASGLTVEIFDGAFYSSGSDFVFTGDHPHAGDGPTTIFLLYGPDPTPLDTTDGNNLLCKVRYTPQPPFGDFDGDGLTREGPSDWDPDPGDDLDGDGNLDWDDVDIGYPGGVAALWDRMCGGVFNEGPGIYPLRVVIEPPPAGQDHRGLNRYSLRASTSSGPAPRIAGLGDMAIYVNFGTGITNINLAEVSQVHAGKDLVIELYDADQGNAGVEILKPDGTRPQCSATTTDGRSTNGVIDCNINYNTHLSPSGGGDLHRDHIQIRVAIPSGYTCSADCWWTINVDYPGGANDNSTWSARIEGNPVRLVR